MSLHSSSSVNGGGSTPKEPLYKILDELRSLKLWKEKKKRKEKGKKKSGRNKSFVVYIIGDLLFSCDWYEQLRSHQQYKQFRLSLN